MAKKDEKESLIGKIIYGFLMFAPLIAIGSSILYSIFNKNAVNDYVTEKTFTTNSIETKDDIFNGNLYELDYNQRTGSAYIPIQYVSFFAINNDKDFIYPSNVAYFTFRIAPTQINITGLDSLGNTLFNYTYLHYYDKASFGVYFVLDNFTGDNYEYIKESSITKFNVVSNDIVDNRNSFYYALDRVQNENIFTWAKNNEIYDGLKYVCNELSIENEFYPMILSYWLIISVIYFIYDIILIIFHVLHTNIHKLECM